MDNREIAATFVRLADLLAIADERDAQRQRDFRVAAETIERCPEPVARLAAEDRLTTLEGIGDGLAARIRALVETGVLADWDELCASFPPSLLELLRVPGLGARSVRRLHDELGVTDVASLERAARDGRIRALPGFGPRRAESLLEGIASLRAESGEPHPALAEAHAPPAAPSGPG